MRVCSISWDAGRDVTKIKYNEEFETSDWLVKADVLRDAIYMLTEVYYHVLSEKEKIWKENLQKKAIEDSVKLSASK